MFGIAKYDGNNFYAMACGFEWDCSFPIGNPQAATNGVRAIVRYNNEIYVTGIFKGPGNNKFHGLAKWNGRQWVSVGGGIKGGIGNNINKMVVYKGLLYVARTFESAGTNTFAKGIATWDGNKWENVGGGLEYPWTIQIFDMKVYKDKLYIVGWFDKAGGTPTKQIALWDGTNWCGFGTTDSTFDSNILAIDFYQDTMYIGGGFFTVDGDSSENRIAKYIGTGLDTCGWQQNRHRRIA